MIGHPGLLPPGAAGPATAPFVLTCLAPFTFSLPHQMVLVAVPLFAYRLFNGLAMALFSTAAAVLVTGVVPPVRLPLRRGSACIRAAISPRSS